MREIALRTTLAALLLLLMPTAVWLSGWHWQPLTIGSGHKALYWVTETVTRPWGTLSSAILCVWFLWCLRFRLKPALLLLVIIVSAILVGQYSKTLIKDQVQEPRPYVLWLEQHSGLNEKSFYQQKRPERSTLVRNALIDNTQLPDWLKRHWEFETGYAFPSGHTMFVASWALLGVGLLWPRRRVVTIVVLTAWAVAVMVSRLVLGMHWPRDLISSTLISWVLVTLATWVVQRYCGSLSVPPDEQREIASRGEE